MVIKYVLGFWQIGKRFYIRVYKNQRDYVLRVSPLTATQFDNETEARAIIDKFGLSSRYPNITIDKITVD